MATIMTATAAPNSNIPVPLLRVSAVPRKITASAITVSPSSLVFRSSRSRISTHRERCFCDKELVKPQGYQVKNGGNQEYIDDLYRGGQVFLDNVNIQAEIGDCCILQIDSGGIHRKKGRLL